MVLCVSDFLSVCVWCFIYGAMRMESGSGIRCGPLMEIRRLVLIRRLWPYDGLLEEVVVLALTGRYVDHHSSSSSCLFSYLFYLFIFIFWGRKNLTT